MIMSFSRTMFLLALAVKFSLAVSLAYAVLRLLWLKLRNRRFDLKRELALLAFTAYFAALVKIIALRNGSDGTRELLLIPFSTTLNELKSGAWPFAFHTVGNTIWFVPLGMFLEKKNLRRAVLTGAGVSVGLEILQWIMATGVTDVDDVIINTLGTLIGWGLMRILRRKNALPLFKER